MRPLPSLVDRRPTDENWLDIFDDHGQFAGQVNPATGEFRAPRPLPTLADQRSAEAYLPPFMQATVRVSNEVWLDPASVLELLSFQQQAQASQLARTAYRDIAKKRQQGKPLGWIWEMFDNASFDHAQGQEFRESGRTTLTRLRQIQEQRAELIAAMNAGLIDGAKLTAEQARLEVQREQQAFEASLTNDERGRQHEYRMTQLTGEQRLNELKVQINADRERQTQADEHEQIQSLLDAWNQIPAVISELDYLRDGDAGVYVHAQVQNLQLIDTLLGDYAGIDAEKRAAARLQLLRMGAPSIWTNVQGFLNRQTREVRHQARRSASPPPATESDR